LYPVVDSVVECRGCAMLGGSIPHQTCRWAAAIFNPCLCTKPQPDCRKRLRHGSRRGIHIATALARRGAFASYHQSRGASHRCNPKEASRHQQQVRPSRQLSAASMRARARRFLLWATPLPSHGQTAVILGDESNARTRDQACRLAEQHSLRVTMRGQEPRKQPTDR
jgi:hypothetical protein